MAFDLDLAEIEPNAIDTGGFVEVPGWFKCRLDEITYDDYGRTVFHLVVVDDGVPKSLSSTWAGCLINRFKLPDPSSTNNRKKATDRILIIGERLGLHTKADIEAWKAAGKGAHVEFEKAVGRLCWCEMAMQTGDDSVVRCQPTYVGIRALDDPKVPANAAAAGGPAPAKGKRGAAPAANGAAAASSPQAAAPATTNADFLDI